MDKVETFAALPSMATPELRKFAQALVAAIDTKIAADPKGQLAQAMCSHVNSYMADGVGTITKPPNNRRVCRDCGMGETNG